MITIGITGGVGAGKSEILKFLEKTYDGKVLKADEIAHFLEKKGQSCYNKLVLAFGNQILAEDGEIDKAAFAKVIFSEGKNLNLVNSIVHPEVKKYILQTIEEERERGSQFLFLEAALLLEDGYDQILDEIWYIYASETTRAERLRKSRGYSDEKIAEILRNQLSEEEFREKCKFVIDNNSSVAETTAQIANYVRCHFGN